MIQLELRELQARDVFSVLNIINKLDIMEEVKELLRSTIDEETVAKIANRSDEAISEDLQKEIIDTQTGLALVETIADFVISKVPKAEQEINGFIGELTGTDEQTIASLPLKEYVRLLKDFFGHPDLKEFLDSLSQLIQLA